MDNFNVDPKTHNGKSIYILRGIKPGTPVIRDLACQIETVTSQRP